MGRPKRVPAAAGITVTATPPETTDASAPDPQTQDQLDAIEGQGTKEAKARITRWNESLGQYATLDYVPVANVEESWIKDEYGGGKYKVYFLGPRADGTYGYLKGQVKDYVIDPSIPFRGAQRKRPGDAPEAAVIPAGSSLMDMGALQIFKTMQDNSVMVMTMMRDNSTAQAAMLERLAAPREGPLEKLLPLLVPVVTAFIQAQGQKKEPLEMVREFAQIMKSNDSGGGVREAMGIMRDMMEMREMLGTGTGGDGDGDPPWWRLLEKVVPGAIEVIKMEAAKRGTTVDQLARTAAPARAIPAPAPVVGAPAVPVPVPEPAAPAAPAPESTAVADEWTPLEPYIQQLVGFAQRNTEPYDMMKTIKTLAPRPLLAALRELVVREDALPFLMQRFPALQPHQAWTDQLLDEFHADFFGDDDGGDEGADDPPAGAPTTTEG